MARQKIYNLKHLVSILTSDRKKRPYLYPIWKPAKRYWLWWNREAGFYDDEGTLCSEEFILRQMLDNRGYIKDHKIFYYPKIMLSFSNGTEIGIWRKRYVDIKTLVNHISTVRDEYLDLTEEPNIWRIYG